VRVYDAYGVLICTPLWKGIRERPQVEPRESTDEDRMQIPAPPKSSFSLISFPPFCADCDLGFIRMRIAECV